MKSVIELPIEKYLEVLTDQNSEFYYCFKVNAFFEATGDKGLRFLTFSEKHVVLDLVKKIPNTLVF